MYDSKPSLMSVTQTSKVIPMAKAGTLGFGVGVCPENISKLGMEPLPGYDDVENNNYGNYIHKPSGSIMCWIPAFKYRVNDTSTNSVQVWDVNDPECPSNAILHRAFINGGQEKSGFFCDKYICSPDAANTMGISVKNGSTLSLTTNTSYGNRTAQLANCSGRFDDAITASRARGTGFQCMSVFQLGALRLLVLAHAQASKSNEFNAWYDSTGQHNLPRGNTNYLEDYDDSSVTWAADPKYAYKGLTGSCNTFAKSTHNGQNSGVADLKGILIQVVTGYIGSGSYYFLKPEVDITTLNADAMYNTSNHNSRSMPFTDWHGWDQNKPMFNNDSTGIHWDCCGFLNTVTNVGDKYIAGMFEKNQEYISSTSNNFPVFGCNWYFGDLQGYGLFFSRLYFSRSNDSDFYYGFRACGYL
nr:MAG TPA: hypothetical protein [Caudoviricetes sp.]